MLAFFLFFSRLLLHKCHFMAYSGIGLCLKSPVLLDIARISMKKLLFISSLVVFSSLWAQEVNDNVEEVTVVGSRSEARSPQDTFSPVDVISGSEFQNNGDTDFNNLMRNLVPSFSVNDQPISDAASVMRPANLRGMSPDHTLVLG